MRIKNLCLVLLTLLVCGACHKEESTRLEIMLEPMGGAAKLTVVDDIDAVWNDGDIININGSAAEVHRIDGHAYIEAPALRDYNRACYPASLANIGESDAVTVTLPAAYHYRIDGSGNQLVDMPLVARNASGDPLEFKHLTAALCITLTNNQASGLALVIDSVSVSSNAYRLSGEYSVNLSAIGSFGAQALGGSGLNRVTLFFDRQRLEIPYGESRKVLIPVPPVGEGNLFTVKVAARYQGRRYNYSQTQTTGGPLSRNVLAYAKKVLSGSAIGNLFGGSGSKNTPYLLYNASDFIAMAEAVTNEWARGTGSGNYNQSCYKLMNNLDMDNITIAPISGLLNARFDGNNKAISNLTVVGSGNECGLFASIESVNITNLTLNDNTVRSTCTSGELSIGAFAGIIKDCKLEGCIVNGLTVSTGNTMSYVYLGGLVGHTKYSDTLTSCSVDYSQRLSMNTNSGLYYGGLIGYCEKGFTGSTRSYLPVSDCSVSSSLNITTNNKPIYAGGLIGYTSAVNVSIINNCSWSGDMSFSNNNGTANIGKLIGAYYMGTNGSLTITNSSGTGTITANGEPCTQNVGNNGSY